jgi:hypothetical protein
MHLLLTLGVDAKAWGGYSMLNPWTRGGEKGNRVPEMNPYQEKKNPLPSKEEEDTFIFAIHSQQYNRSFGSGKGLEKKMSGSIYIK